MKPFRIERVASEVRSLVSAAIRTELHDPRIAPLTSITRVDVSRDLETAKVHVSVFGDDAEQRRTMAGLLHARGFIQSFVAKALPIRQCPKLEFELDHSIKKQAEISALIDASLADSKPPTQPEIDDAAPDRPRLDEGAPE